MNYPPGTENDPKAPWNDPGPVCEGVEAHPVGKEPDGSLIYEDRDCNREADTQCAGCGHWFCNRHLYGGVANSFVCGECKKDLGYGTT